MTAFFQEQLRQRPALLEEHFLDVVYGAVGEDVLFITGMREEAPVAALAHLVPDSRLLDVHVQANERTRKMRRDGHTQTVDSDNDTESGIDIQPENLTYAPDLLFNNNQAGGKTAKEFAQEHLQSLFDNGLQQITDMVRLIPNFPQPSIDFRHVLGITDNPRGLPLCTYLLYSLFTGDWSTVDAVVACEVGGLLFAPALASKVVPEIPFVIMREAGKLPPPTISVAKCQSHISSAGSPAPSKDRIEMARDVLPKGAKVVVVDDVLATGKTLCAVLQLLAKAGVSAKDVSVLVVVEFPSHRGRKLLRERGFGKVGIRSLVVFGGA